MPTISTNDFKNGMSIELSDDTLIDIPGKIYSEVGLTGELQSNFLLEADTVNTPSPNGTPWNPVVRSDTGLPKAVALP